MKSSAGLVLCFVVCVAATVARAQSVGGASQPSFYDVLKADPAHKLIMRAVEMDKEGVTKAMLQKKMPVTALVPTDTAFILAGLKYKLGSRPEDMQKIMQNTCLINAILKQHIIPGVYNTTQLRKLYSKPSMLVTKKAEGSKMVPVYWPLKFKYLEASDALTVSSSAVDAKTKKPIINGTVISPMNVQAGGGMVHNVNALLLPTTNMTRLIQITNCSVVSPPTQ
ncbi:hypothetical protein OEZ85_003678 [Tetradesmus obliquus]|uniref:FAS1 domain-containing protein n=1 Tax=Tetradesmus obliquus TaxID=3088 RepID=A0ABY8UCN2_TETOB|nr:hypothetical protein OEZ85_003678 [Tetradesmus obliquus]